MTSHRSGMVELHGWCGDKAVSCGIQFEAFPPVVRGGPCLSSGGDSGLHCSGKARGRRRRGVLLEVLLAPFAVIQRRDSCRL